MNHTLYRFFDEDGKLLYVGRTMDPAKRLAKHRLLKPFWLHTARIEMQRYSDAAALAAAETEAIRSEEPLYNVHHNGNGKRSPDPRVETCPKCHHRLLVDETICQSCGLHLRDEFPCGLDFGAYAFGLSDGQCPVGLLVTADEHGIRFTPYNWESELFSLADQWFHTRSLIAYRRAETLPAGYDGWDPKYTVFDMEPLGRFQTEWTKLHEAAA